MNSNYVYMHNYCSKMLYLHVFTPTDVGTFSPKMCMYDHFLYFRLTNVSTLTWIDMSALILFENYLAPFAFFSIFELLFIYHQLPFFFFRRINYLGTLSCI